MHEKKASSLMKELIIKTRSGAVRGRDEHGIASFKGIPFSNIDECLNDYKK